MSIDIKPKIQVCFYCKGSKLTYENTAGYTCKACEGKGSFPLNNFKAYVHQALGAIHGVFFPTVPREEFQIIKDDDVAIIVVRPNHLFIVEKYDQNFFVWIPAREKNIMLFSGTIISEFNDPEQLRAYLAGQGIRFHAPVNTLPT